MVNEKDILIYYFSSSHGIKHTAKRFNLPMIYVAKLIIKYKKSKGIR